MKNYAFVLVSILLSLMCNGQNARNNTYSTGKIPKPERFEKLTSYELHKDSLTEKNNQKRLARMKDGTAFKEGLSEKEKQEAIDYEMTVKQPYKDNRSRYFLKQFVNHTQDKEFLSDVDTVTTDCSCYLSNDTIKVNMGIWVFGGFGVNILITKNNFLSTYWEDEHEQKIYKTTLMQPNLSDNVFAKNKMQQLILKEKPNFTVGENIFGYLKFKTNHYYRSADYQSGFASDNYSDAKMNTIHTQGEVYFKCQLRKKTEMDD